MTNTQIGLFRHGQTDWNIQFLLQGITDIPMNETGFRQVRTASEVIRGESWDVLLTSPLTRARQSAEILANDLGFESVIEESLLIERSFGEAEGLSHSEWKQRYTDLDVIPGGESRSQLRARSVQLLEEMTRRYPGKRVLAISHGALIRTLLAIASEDQLPREGERMGNASLNLLGHGEDRWSVLSYRLEPLTPENP